MSLRHTRVLPSKEGGLESSAQFFRVRFRTLEMPPIRDGVIIGKNAPITSDAMQQTLKLVSTDRFVEMPVSDEVIGTIIVRDGLLRKLSTQAIEQFVLERVKPYMSNTEVLRLDIDLETLVEGAF